MTNLSEPLAWYAEKEQPQWDEEGTSVVGTQLISKVVDNADDAKFFEEILGYRITPLFPKHIPQLCPVHKIPNGLPNSPEVAFQIGYNACIEDIK